MDVTGSAGPAQPAPACAPGCAAATVLLGIRGLLVTAVTVTAGRADPGGGDHRPRRGGRAVLPAVRQAATRVKEHPRTAPRDVFIGDRQVLLDWPRPGGAAAPPAVSRGLSPSGCPPSSTGPG